MVFELETAAHPENLKRVVIEPVTRVEGHGKVTLLLDADNEWNTASNSTLTTPADHAWGAANRRRYHASPR